MKPTLTRMFAATLVLLAPLGTMLIAAPAAAQPPAAAPMLGGLGGGVPSRVTIIERFDLSGTVAPGNEVRFRVQGQPGGTAFLQVPGVLPGMQLPETSPGVYEGRHVLAASEDPRAFFAATVTLHAAGTRATVRLGGSASAPVYGSAEAAREEAWRRGSAPPPHAIRDDRAPQISGITPSQGDRVRDRDQTRISAHFTDEGSGVDRGTIRLIVDGRDVTSRASIDRDDIRYVEDLAPGRHHAELILRDRAGNVARRAWNFEVVGSYRRGPYGDSQDYGRPPRY
jgi:hypothetical protein